MKQACFPFDLKKNGYSVLCYGGHDSMLAELQKCLPGIKLMRSTQRRMPTTHFGNYDLIVAFPTNISHSSNAAVKGAAQRAGVRFRTLVHKGAETAALEILDLLR